MNNNPIIVTVDCKQAIKDLNRLKRAVKGVVNAAQPKWWQFWRWFRPVVINLNHRNLVKFE